MNKSIKTALFVAVVVGFNTIQVSCDKVELEQGNCLAVVVSDIPRFNVVGKGMKKDLFLSEILSMDWISKIVCHKKAG